MKSQKKEKNTSVSDILSATVKGNIQAVSKEGKVIVTTENRKFFVYTLDEGSIRERKFDLPYSFEPPKELFFYSEQIISFPSFYPTIKNNQTVVFIISQDNKSVLKVTVGDSEEDICFEEQKFQDVLDIAIHPVEDCLAVLTKNSIQLAFKQQGTHVFPIPTSVSPVKAGKIQIVKDSEHKINYFAFMVEENSKAKMKIHRYIELDYTLKSHSLVRSKKVDITSDSFKHERFQGVSYDRSSKLFAVAQAYLDDSRTSSKNKNWLIDFELNVSEWKSDQGFGSERRFHFIDFLQDSNKFLTAGLWYYHEDPLKLFPRSICTVPFSVSQEMKAMKTDTASVKCLQIESMNNRVSSWGEEDKFILTQEAYHITVYNENLEYVSQFEGQAFSVKGKDLIVLNDGQVKVSSSFHDFDKWQSKNFRAESIFFTLALSFTFGLLLACLITLLIGLCHRRRERQTGSMSFQSTVHEQLPIEVKSKIYNEEQLNERKFALCSICLAGNCDCELPCQHLFHQECIRQWIEKQPTCPGCRFRTSTIIMIS